MSRLLLLMTTTTYKAAAFLAAAERLGVPATVGTDRRQALAHLNPEGNLTLDFSRPTQAAETIASFARRLPLAAILATDDDGVELAALAAGRLGLPHNPPEAVAATRDKRLLRERLARAGLSGPSFRPAAPEDDAIALARQVPYPCVLKPAGLSASRGVVRADDEASFVAAFERLRALAARADASPSSGFLVESFIPGREVAVEGLLDAGALRVLAVFDKPDPLDGPTFEETLYVTPSRLPAETLRQIEAELGRGCRALGLVTGPVHAELRLPDGVPWVLEIAARSIGGLCARALRFDGGRSLEELLLEHALGRPTAGIAREAAASGVMMIPIPRAGILREVRGLDEARGVADIEAAIISIAPGTQVEPVPEGSRYLGFLFARAATPERVEQALREAHARLDIRIETAETLKGRATTAQQGERDDHAHKDGH